MDVRLSSDMRIDCSALPNPFANAQTSGAMFPGVAPCATLFRGGSRVAGCSRCVELYRHKMADRKGPSLGFELPDHYI